MTHFVVGIIVPKEDIDIHEDYISSVMEKYSEEFEVEQYIDKTKEEVIKEFKDSKKKYPEYKDKTLKDWAKDWYGSDLDEKGNSLSTFNPDSFYDWYEIGGRWDGELTDKKGENTIKIKDLIKKFKEKEDKDKIKKLIKNIEGETEYNRYLLYSLIINGEYIKSKEYGWFGMSNDIKSPNKWKKEYLEILEKHKEDFMINLDCHV